MDKDVGLRIRVQRELREQFVAACRAEDKPAAQVIREFMRSYVSDQKRSQVVADSTNKKSMEPHGNKEV